MNFNGLDNKIARLILLQRIELISPLMSRIRKLFGRYLFTNFFSKYFLSKDDINHKYFQLMVDEYKFLENFISLNNKKFLSIGSGMCGLELVIDYFNKGNHFSVIEKNYVSKKVKYGWDKNNFEAYNNLDILKKFLKKNTTNSIFEIYDFEKDKLPNTDFDIVISLYSLDYHYDFKIYEEYLRKNSSDQTQIIFDTIRPDYFKSIFHKVEFISSTEKKIHSSKRIMCSNFIK